MAERGTFLGEVQVAATSAGRRFWALPWKYKGSAMGVAAVVLIGAATAGGGEDSNSKDAFQASAGVSPTTSSPLGLVGAASGTPEKSAEAATTATPAKTAAPTKTPKPPTNTPIPPTETPLPPTATSAPPTAAGLGCTASASVDNATPAKNSNVTVTGALTCTGASPEGATMSTSWAYKSTTSNCSGTAGADGVASCTRGIGGATAGYTVRITVVFTLQGQTFRTTTAFTPQ